LILCVLRNDLVWVVNRGSDHSARFAVSSNLAADQLAAAELVVGALAALDLRTGLALRLLVFLRYRNADLPSPMAAADDDLASVEDEQRLVEADLCDVVLEQDVADCVRVELLLLFAAGEGRLGIHLVRLVDPHVEAHLAIVSGSRN
jgi:hypothetical protein